MGNIKISVIVPIYNVEAYLQDCVHSVLTQTYPHFELVLVDDGSPDNCPCLCDEWGQKDARIKVVHKENGGVSSARNAGLDLATGDYIYFLDADDWLEKTALQTLVESLQRQAVDCMGFSFVKEFENSSERNQTTLWEERTYYGEEMELVRRRAVGLTGEELKKFTQMNAFSVLWAKLYKKSVIDEHHLRFHDVKTLGSFEDGLFNVAFFKHANSFSYLDEALYHYRKTNAGSITANYKKDFLAKQTEQLRLLKELIGDKHEEAYQNRVAYMAMEYCSNALKHKAKFAEKYREMKAVFHSPYTAAVKALALKKLPKAWKIYYTLLKMKCGLGVYAMTRVILKMRQKKGKRDGNF